VARVPPKRLRNIVKSSLEATRRIQAKVIPRTEERIESAERRVSASIGRQLKTTQRVHDPD